MVIDAKANANVIAAKAHGHNGGTVEATIAGALLFVYDDDVIINNSVGAIVHSLYQLPNKIQSELLNLKIKLKTAQARANYYELDISGLSKEFIKRIGRKTWSNNYMESNDKEIDISIAPTPDIINDFKFKVPANLELIAIIMSKSGFSDNDRSSLYDWLLNNPSFTRTDLTKFKSSISAALEDYIAAEFDSIQHEDNFIANPQFTFHALSTEEQQIFARIDMKINETSFVEVEVHSDIDDDNKIKMEHINKERADAIKLNIYNQNILEIGDGMLRVHNRYYDQKQMLLLLIAIKNKNEAAFIVAIANIISGLPNSLSLQKNAFRYTFTHMFITGNFPNKGLKLSYLHFLLRCGQVH